MNNVSRRQFIGMTAAGLGATSLRGVRSEAAPAGGGDKPRPVLHATDLFRPHMDPDDHWDLTCVYAMAHRGDIDLRGILIDHPPRDSGGRNPDIAAVAQMNLIAGLAVPVAVGSSLPLKSRDDIQPSASSVDHHGVNMVLDVLRNSPDPVAINILGSSRDIAIAGKKAPGLFASKCAAIYLNAGTGSPAMTSQSKLEYNVTLDRFAFAAIFDLPCRVYWMPCFEDFETRRQRPIRQFGTHYQLRQSDILPHLSDRVRKYFAYMFGRYQDSKWLEYLKRPLDEPLLSRFLGTDRHMWCTAGFLHAAGYTAAANGAMRPLTEGSDSAVFAFDGIRVECSDQGLTKWQRDGNSEKRFMFHVRDTGHYQSAMTTALRTILTELP